MSFFDRLRHKPTFVSHEHAKEDQKAKREHEAQTTTDTSEGTRMVGSANAVLIRPLISERSATAESFGAYTFVVANSATKHAVREAIFSTYGVRPIKVRVMNVEGKILRSGKHEGRRSDWKKAIVTLKKGDSIHIHEGV